MKKPTKIRLLAWILGVAMVLMVIHWIDQPFIHVISIAQLGTLIIAICLMYFVNIYKGSWKELLGSRWLYIPLAVIVLSMATRPLVAYVTGNSQLGMTYELSSILYGLFLFGIYLMARGLKEDVFTSFFWLAFATAISCIVVGLVNLGVPNGGIISLTNYDIATGVIVFGFIAGIVKHKWLYLPFIVVGLYFTGAFEAVFACAFIGLVIFLREYLIPTCRKKKLLPVAILILLILLIVGTGITGCTYSHSLTDRHDVLFNGADAPMVNNYPLSLDATADWLTFYRLRGYQKAVEDYHFLGNGFNYGHFYWDIPHNVPLIIIHQLGIIAAMAWCFVVGYGLLKTKWTYAWLAVIALSVFDHFMWTQAGTWFWALAGVSSASKINNDYIFKGANNE